MDSVNGVVFYNQACVPMPCSNDAHVSAIHDVKCPLLVSVVGKFSTYDCILSTLDL